MPPLVRRRVDIPEWATKVPLWILFCLGSQPHVDTTAMKQKAAVAIALQDAAPPPTIGTDAKNQALFEGVKLSRQKGGANPYDLEPDPPPDPAPKP